MIPPLSESPRPLRQQIFERVRASGSMPRIQVAKELNVSPATVTTLTSELIEAGLIESRKRAGTFVTHRQTKGRDLLGACGQLGNAPRPAIA